MTNTWTFNGEEIEATFSARMVRDSYGVAGSPEWLEATEIELESVAILGKDYPVESLPKELVDHLVEIAWEEGEFE